MDVDGDPSATSNINALDNKAIDSLDRLEAAGAAQAQQQRQQQQQRQSGGDLQAQAHAAQNDERWWLSEGETDDDEDGEDGSNDDGSSGDEDGGRGGRRRKAKGSGGGEGEGAGDAPPPFYDPNADEAVRGGRQGCVALLKSCILLHKSGMCTTITKGAPKTKNRTTNGRPSSAAGA
jgi:hypothetical protein